MAIATQGALVGAGASARDSQSHHWRHLGLYQNSGVISGFELTQGNGLTLKIAESADNAAVAKSSYGNFLITTSGEEPTVVTLDAPSATSKTTYTVVVWRLATGSVADKTIDGVDDSYCGIAAVAGTGDKAPTDTQITSGIGADKIYAPIGIVTLPAGATDVSGATITQGEAVKAKISTDNIDFANFVATAQIWGLNSNKTYSSATVVTGYASKTATNTDILEPNTSTGRITVKRSGFITVSAAMMFGDSAGAYGGLSIQKNGGDVVVHYSAMAVNYGVRYAGTWTGPVNAGDYFTMQVKPNGSWSTNGGGNRTYITAMLIAP